MFQSTHNLPFETAGPYLGGPCTIFRVGTCHGLYLVKKGAYEIIAIVNEKPGNGHFDDVLEWFEESCRRDDAALRVIEIMNTRFYRHLTEQRGFAPINKVSVEKRFPQTSSSPAIEPARQAA